MEIYEIIAELRTINPWVMGEQAVDNAIQKVIEELEAIEEE